MKKIIIIGTTGSGKSTLAKKLSRLLGIEHIQLDFLFWKPNWTESDDAEFFSKISEAINCESWIIDGNYGRTQHLTWPVADTVIWIDLPFWPTLYQNISRSIYRSITREEIWKGTGNKESFIKMFSKDSIVKWLFKTYDSNKERYSKNMQNEKFKNINFIHLKSRKEIEFFLKNIN
jgi:adenylate kinase family enzyme